MALDSGTLFQALTVGAVSLSAWLYLRQREMSSVARLEDLGVVVSMLRRHRDTLKRFLDAPEAPVDLKRRLLRFSDGIGDAAIGRDLAEWILSPRFLDREEMDPELGRLEKEQPDLAEDFRSAVLSGLCASILTLPDGGASFRKVFRRVFLDPGSDMGTASAATHYASAPADRIARRPLPA